MRVLANDGLEKGAINELELLGVEVVTDHLEKDQLINKICDFDVLIVRSATKVTADVLDAASNGNLKLVIRAGVGVDNIDVPYAKKLNIDVRNTPSASSNAVAELALAHILAVSRYIGVSNFSMRNGQWNKKKYKGCEIAGKTLGIVGIGRIGRLLGEKAEALGMNVIYTDLLGKQDNISFKYVEFEELLKESDYISLHVPYDKNSGALIGKKEIELMKDGVFLINCARGKVVDEKALLEGLNSGKIAGAGIDVFEEEPTSNMELINHPNVSVTPHIGASTNEAQDRIGKEVVNIVKEYIR